MNLLKGTLALLAGIFVVAMNLFIFLSALWIYFQWSLDHGNIH